MSDLDLVGLRKIAEAAHDHIGNLCTGEDRWRMTVPPRDDDSDMLFSTLADGVLALLDRIEELEGQLDAADRQIEARSGETAGERLFQERCKELEEELAEFRAREAASTWDEGECETWGQEHRRNCQCFGPLNRPRVRRLVGPWEEVTDDE